MVAMSLHGGNPAGGDTAVSPLPRFWDGGEKSGEHAFQENILFRSRCVSTACPVPLLAPGRDIYQSCVASLNFS